MKQSQTIDMTTGPIMKKVFLFALPIILGNILQQMYTTVDTLIIGNFCGELSIAAVGTSAQPVEILLCIFLGIGSGVSIKIAQHVGSSNIKNIKQAMDATVFFVYLVGITLCVIGFWITPFILKMICVPADTWPYALNYTRIVFLGTLGNIGYNMNAGILRGLGDSKASLYFLIISCIVNVILDLAFVAGFKMNTVGAALATMISLYLSWFVSIYYIRKKFPQYSFQILPKPCNKKELQELLSLGLPIGINNSLYSVGHTAMQTLINQQGSAFMAGISVGGRVTGMANVAITALSAAAMTYSGQNYGAHNYERLRKGYIKIPLISGLITLLGGILILLIRIPILTIFTKEPTVLLYAERYVLVILLSQWIYSIFNSMMNLVNGVGLVRYTTVVNLIMLWGIRIPCAYLISRFWDGKQIMLSMTISFLFATIMMIGYYAFSKEWKQILQTK